MTFKILRTGNTLFTLKMSMGIREDPRSGDVGICTHRFIIGVSLRIGSGVGWHPLRHLFPFAMELCV